MALVLSNRVQETTTTTGTGAITLAGAVAGFQSFAAIGDGNTTYYTVTSGTAWEVGIGTYTAAGTTLARTTILSSSAGGAAITLAGTSTVFVTYPAERTIANGYGTLPVANGGTNSTATATAGGVAYGTGTAIVVNAAGPAGYVLTSGGAAPPVWTPVASLAVGTDAYWGSFWDTTTQTAPAPNTAYMLTLNSADPTNNGVTVVSGSRVTFTHAGVYSLTFSIQFENTDNANAAHDVNVWLRKNDSGSTGDVPDSDSKFTVPPKHAGVKGSLIGTVNFVLTLAAGDFIELVYAVSDVTVTVASTPPGTSPVSPRIPSIIFTAVAAAPVGLGYGGVESFTSLTVGTGSKTFTVNTNATDTAFIVGNRVRLVNSSVNYMDGVITAYSGTSMTVLVDGTAGSGTYTAWFVTLTGSVGGVTSFSGNSTGLTPATATTGAIALGGTLNVANGGTGATTLSSGFHLKGNDTSAVSASIIYETGTFAGFNTTTPQATIDFGSTVGQAILLYRGGTDKYGAEVRAVDGGATGTNIFAGYSGPIRFRTSGATFVPVTRMIVTSTGDVGIGTNAPVAPLSVVGDILAPSINTNTTYKIGIQDAPANAFVTSKRGSVTLQASSAVAGASAMGGGDLNLNAGNSYGYATSIDGDVNIRAGYNLLFGNVGSIIGYTGNAERFRVNSSGSVGIGTSTPAYRLDVKPAAFAAGTALAPAINITTANSAGSGNTSQGALTWQTPAGTRVASINPFFDDPSATFRTSMAFSTSDLGGTNLERMRLTSDGYLLVGGTTTGLGNAGRGLVDINGSASAILGLSTGGTLAGYIYHDSTGMAVWQQRNSYIAFGTNATEKMRLTAEGSLGLGTSAPGNKLHVVAATQVDADGLIRAENTATSGVINSTVMVKTYYGTSQFMQWENNGVRIGCRSTANGGAGNIVFTTGTDDEKMRLTATGSLGIGTTAPAAPLDVTATLGGFSPTGGSIQRLTNPSATGQSPLDFIINGTLRSRLRSDYAGNMTFVANGGGHYFFVGGDSGVGSPAVIITPTSILDLSNGVGQIQFPAAQVASANANTLDDYEEGSWTPRLSGTGGGDYTPGGVNGGRYIKIGKMVYATCSLQWTAQVTAYSGNSSLTGLPFTSSGARAIGSMGAVSSGLSFTAGYGEWNYLIDPGYTFVYIIQNSTTGSGYSHNPTVGATGIVYGLTIVYEAAN